MVLPLDPVALGWVNGVTLAADRTNEVGAMKKWYSSVSAILVMALAVQLTGCASTSRTFARWTGRDKDDQEVAEIDGKAAKDTAAKGRSEAKRPSASQASKSKSKPETPDDERIVAKKVDPKSEQAQSDKAKSTASTKTGTPSPRGKITDEPRVAAASKSEDAKRPSAPKGDVAAKTASVSKPAAPKTSTAAKTAAVPKTERSADPFAEFDVAADDSVVPSLASSKALKSTTVSPAASETPAVAEKRNRPQVDPDFEEFATNQSAKKIQEVAHRGEEDDLPEWASGKAPSRASAKAVKKVDSPESHPDHMEAKKPAVKAAVIAKTAEPQKSAPPVAPKETLVSLCPDATGEVRELVRTLNADDLEVVKRSIHRLGRLQGEAAAASPALEKLLLHRDGFVRVHAALALVRMQQVTPFVTETLIVGLRSSDPSVRSFSAAVLAEMGPGSAEALPALSTALRDSDGFVRLHVAEVLIRHENFSQVALDTLLKCLKDEDENVRWLATYSLAELAPQSLDATSALERCLSDASPKVCVGAAYALGEIGPMARSATTSLQRCAHSSDPELQAAVAYALRQVKE